MTLYNQIQQLIVKCIDRSIDVKTFREQFVQLFFSINRKFDIDAVALADRVDNLYGDVLIGLSSTSRRICMSKERGNGRPDECTRDGAEV